MKPKTILIMSGGMDSSTLLHFLLDRMGHEVKALGIDYGQRHKKELQAALHICELRGVECKIADLTAITSFLAGSSQTSDDIEVPEGHYADESMKQTVVPNRNMIMLSVAAGWAISQKYNHVAYAAHTGDHTIYPDCRPEFAECLNQAIRLADWHEVTLLRPFVNFTKDEICKVGAALKVPFDVTWSCYKGKANHCGKCGTCVERIEAFKLAGVPDPTVYNQYEGDNHIDGFVADDDVPF